MLEIVIGLVLTPPALYLMIRAINRTRGVSAKYQSYALSNNGGRAWGLPLAVVIIGIILIVKGIVGL